MKKNTNLLRKPLHLHRETVKLLDDAQLERPAGGYLMPSWITCATVCTKVCLE